LAQAADRGGSRGPEDLLTAANQVKLKPATPSEFSAADNWADAGDGRGTSGLHARCLPDPDSPAFDVVLNATCAEYADVEALELSPRCRRHHY